MRLITGSKKGSKKTGQRKQATRRKMAMLHRRQAVLLTRYTVRRTIVARASTIGLSGKKSRWHRSDTGLFQTASRLHPGAPAERSGASLEVRNTPSLAPDRPGVSLQYPAAPSPLRASSFGSFPSWDSVSANCDPCCDDSPYLAESSSRPRATCIKVCLSPSDFSCIPSLPRSRDTFPRALLRRACVTFTCRHNSSQTLVAAFK